MTKSAYPLTLHKTYYNQGFFNLGVSVSGYVRPSSGPAVLNAGAAKTRFSVHVNREANANGTPRIMGGAEFRNWIQRNCSEMEVVDVEIISPGEFWLRKRIYKAIPILCFGRRIGTESLQFSPTISR